MAPLVYYNGTPAATAFVGIDYVVPTFTNWTSIDLVVAGPNVSLDIEDDVHVFSLTSNSSALTSVHSCTPFLALLVTPMLPSAATSLALLSPVATASSAPTSGSTRLRRRATLTLPRSKLSLLCRLSAPWSRTPPQASAFCRAATVSGELVCLSMLKTTARLTIFNFSVNTPFITSLTNASCVNPPFVQTRLTGNADYDKAVYNATSGLFTYANIVPNGGGNTCINGDCSLPGETAILNSGCQASVSVFTVDYDAPTGPLQADIRSRLSSVVKYVNGTGPSASTSVSSSVCPCASSSTLRTTISGASGAAGSSSHSPSVKATGSSSSHSPNVKATGSSSSHSSSKKATSSSSSHSPSAKATGSSSSHSAGASPSSHTTSAALPGHGFSSSSPAAHSPPGYDPAPTYAYHERARDQY